MCRTLRGESRCSGAALIGSPGMSHQASLPPGRSELRNSFFGSYAWIHGSSLGHSLLSQEIRNAGSSFGEPRTISLHGLTQHTCPESLFSHNSGQGRFQLAFCFLARQPVWLQGACVEEGDTPIRVYVFEVQPICSDLWPPQAEMRTFAPCSLSVSLGTGSYLSLYVQLQHCTRHISGCSWMFV